MNRIEEALRRARRDLPLPESFAAPNAAALEQFSTVEGPEREHADELEREHVAPPAPKLAYESPAAGDEFPARIARSAVAPPPPEPPEATFVAAKTNGGFGGKLVIHEEVKQATIEQYRRLAAALHHAQCNDGIKIVMVASALAGEGKTLTAVNLALTLSESYARRVLLIDADLRRPSMHEIFHMPNVSGLNEGLKADDDRKLTVLEISPRLSLLPAGKPDPDPMSALTSDRMRRVIQEAAAKFDWVVIDTPPVGLLPDAHLLAAMVHVAVLVVRAGRTPCALVQRAIASLDRNRVIGVVLNQIDDRAVSPGGKYEHYYAASYGRGTTDDQAIARS